MSRPTTKKQCDSNPNYSWVKGSNGKRGHCRRKPRKTSRRTSRRTSKRPSRRRSRSRSRTQYVYVRGSPTRTIYVRGASPVRRVYVQPTRRSPVRTSPRPSRFFRSGPAPGMACDILRSPAVCRSSGCSWDTSSNTCS